MRGPLAYIGGKNRLAKAIISVFPPHQTYVEPFAGGAQVLFHKEPSAVEVLNDLDGDVVNFFRICQCHYQELIRYLHFTVVSRRWYELLSRTPVESLTDVQRAARFLYLQKLSFGGRVIKRNYTHHVEKPPNYNTVNLPELIEATHRRLQTVQIESLPYEAILDRFDGKGTLFYLDPPYFRRKLYNFNLSDEDFSQLEKRLRRLKGKFVLSINDTPEIRKLFSKFRYEPITIAYSAQKHAGRRYEELLIRNYA